MPSGAFSDLLAVIPEAEDGEAEAILAPERSLLEGGLWNVV